MGEELYGKHTHLLHLFSEGLLRFWLQMLFLLLVQEITMRASISRVSDIHYLKVILTPVMPNPQNYSLLQHITFMRVAPVFIRYTPELHALWSVWMELATSPP